MFCILFLLTDPFGQKVKFKFASKTETDIDNLTYEKDSPMNALVQEIMMSSYPYFTDDFKGIFIVPVLSTVLILSMFLHRTRR